MDINNICKEIINDTIDDVLKIDHYSKIKLWEYNAKKAYNLLHIVKDSWKFLTPQQKISEAHTFYDIIFVYHDERGIERLNT